MNTEIKTGEVWEYTIDRQGKVISKNILLKNKEPGIQ